MSEITIDVSEAVKKLDPADIEKAINVALDGAADLIRADVKAYPAPPSHSTYVRTGTLGRSWTKHVSRMEAVIGNVTGYAPYVQGADTQAWMHKGRWKTTRDVVEQRKGDIKRLIERSLERWARR